jgi:glycosyltransferase involved in cell wall biosynthesis
VGEDGRSGLLVDPGDVEGLARALSRMANDAEARERMAAAAQEKIARDHDIDVAWPRVLEAMREVIRRP